MNSDFMDRLVLPKREQARPRGDPNEHAICEDIKRALKPLPWCRLYRQSTGMLVGANGKPMRFGLCVGSSDFIGWVITDAGIARFCALEAKTRKGRATPAQLDFIADVIRAGGHAAIVRSGAEALAEVTRARRVG